MKKHYLVIKRPSKKNWISLNWKKNNRFAKFVFSFENNILRFHGIFTIHLRCICCVWFEIYWQVRRQDALKKNCLKLEPSRLVITDWCVSSFPLYLFLWAFLKESRQTVQVGAIVHTDSLLSKNLLLEANPGWLQDGQNQLSQSLNETAIGHSFDISWQTSIHPQSNFSNAFTGKRLISIP